MKQGFLAFLAFILATSAAAVDAPVPVVAPTPVATAPATAPVPTAVTPPPSSPTSAPPTSTVTPAVEVDANAPNTTPVPSFVGVYRCKGMDPYLNQAYTGTVTVTQQNTVYRLDMQYDTGEKSVGTGGLYDKYLMSVVFQDTTDPKNIGLEQYHFTEDYKTMSGYWVYLGKDKLGKEVCERQ